MMKTSPSDPTMPKVKDVSFSLLDWALSDMPRGEYINFIRFRDMGVIAQVDRCEMTCNNHFAVTILAKDKITYYIPKAENITEKEEYHAQTGTRILAKSPSGFSVL